MYSKLSAADISQLVDRGKETVDQILREEAEERESVPVVHKKSNKAQDSRRATSLASSEGEKKQVAQDKIKSLFGAGKKSTPLSAVASPNKPTSFEMYSKLSAGEISRLVAQGKETVEEVLMEERGEEAFVVERKTNILGDEFSVGDKTTKAASLLKESDERPEFNVENGDSAEVLDSKSAAQDKIKSLFGAGKKSTPLSSVASPNEPTNFEMYSKMTPSEIALMISRGKENIIQMKEEEKAVSQKKAETQIPKVDEADLQSSRDEAQNRIKKLMNNRRL